MVVPIRRTSPTPAAACSEPTSCCAAPRSTTPRCRPASSRTPRRSCRRPCSPWPRAPPWTCSAASSPR
jgi:hypothetical protein